MANLDQKEAGRKTNEYLPGDSMSKSKIYNWNSKYSGMKVSEAKELKELERKKCKVEAHVLDNGPTLTSNEFEPWAKEKGITIQHNQLGKPMQNSFIKDFISVYLQSELDAYLFLDLYQVKQLPTEWMEEDNERRPHKALHNLTLEEWKTKYYKLK